MTFALISLIVIAFLAVWLGIAIYWQRQDVRGIKNHDEKIKNMALCLFFAFFWPLWVPFFGIYYLGHRGVEFLAKVAEQ